MQNLFQASAQWMTRPDDERFTSLFALRDHVANERQTSIAATVSNRHVNFAPTKKNPRTGLKVSVNGEDCVLNHFSFGQAANLAGAPAGYLRKLPAPLAADCLNWGLQITRKPEDVGVLVGTTPVDNNGEGPIDQRLLRAATGPNYGRVWNEDIANLLIDRFGDGVTGDFRVPGEFGRPVNVTKANTTLYASDRDMFVFLADEENRIDVGGRAAGDGGLARGFFVWNSEVGSKTLGIAMFLFRYACCNRIVWGAEDYREIRLRHTVSAPDKWLDQVAPVIAEYREASTRTIEQTIAAAQAKRLEDKVDEFLINRFGANTAKKIAETHLIEEQRPIETLWDVVNGVTAMARQIPHQDARVEMETSAGKILDLVAA